MSDEVDEYRIKLLVHLHDTLRLIKFKISSMERYTPGHEDILIANGYKDCLQSAIEMIQMLKRR